MIETSRDTRPFFQKLLRDSFRDLRAEVDPSVEVYVVFLLDEMGKTEYTEEPLGVKMLSSPYPERIGVLKEVGDRSLFVSGFFEERMKKRGLSTSYYAQLSSSAYSELSARIPDPYRTMASQVRLLQRALRGVREACDAMGMDVWPAYERWLQNRSPALERRLIQLGMVLSQLKPDSGPYLL